MNLGIHCNVSKIIAFVLGFTSNVYHQGPYYKNKLELKSNSSESLPVSCKFICVHIFPFMLKVRLKNHKFEFYQFKLRVESQINLQVTGKILLEFDFSSSLLLYYGPQC